MTYGYPPPPRDWRAPEPDDESDPGRARRRAHEPPTVPPSNVSPNPDPYGPDPNRPGPGGRGGYEQGGYEQGGYGAGRYDPGYDPGGGTGSWATPPAGERGPGRRIPQPPPPAKHVPPTGGQHAQPYSPPPYPSSPTAYPTPARPTSPPPSMRRPPPTNAGGQAPAYPAYPPPVPTSPTPRMPPPPPRTGSFPAQAPPGLPIGPPTGSMRTGPMTLPPPGPMGPKGPRTGAINPPFGAPRTTNVAPPTVPNRKPGAPPGRTPARPALPAPKRPRTVSFKDVPGLIKQLPQHKPWMIAIGAIAVAVIVSICGLGSFMLVKDDSAVIGASPTPETTVVKRDIGSRQTDPNPLTAADVFPGTEIVIDPSFGAYKRMGDPQVSEDCQPAVSADVKALLANSGCSQFVRATYVTPDGAYFITAGILNLPDAAAAGKASTDIKGMIEAGQGRFNGYISAPDANFALGRAPTSLAWEVRGHFIVYTVICKVDSTPIDPADTNIRVFVYDILQKYLRDHVILDWSIEKTPASPSPPA